MVEQRKLTTPATLMGKEQELLPCPFCESEVVAVGRLAAPSHPHTPFQASCGTCGACGPEMHTERAATSAWNRRSERAEVVESRDVLFFASYCGGNNPACTPARPCADCIAMGNVYSIPADTKVLFQREFGASPVAMGGVTEAQVEQAFRDGLAYATICDVTDPDEAWRTSRARAALSPPGKGDGQ